MQPGVGDDPEARKVQWAAARACPSQAGERALAETKADARGKCSLLWAFHQATYPVLLYILAWCAVYIKGSTLPQEAILLGMHVVKVAQQRWGGALCITRCSAHAAALGDVHARAGAPEDGPGHAEAAVRPRASQRRRADHHFQPARAAQLGHAHSCAQSSPTAPGG